MPTSSSPSYLRYAAILLLGLFGLVAYWYAQGRAHFVPEITHNPQRLQCASYSPFDHDQSPFTKPLVIHRERIEADVAILAKRFNCLRTYSVVDMESLPEIARRHGMTLMIGAWVSREEKPTRKEIDLLVKTANENPDVVKSVIIGNEALLRKDITAPKLVELISEVKSRIKQPVTYADVWEFWLRHPEVAPAVDFITIHLLPYWEDDPTGIDAALAQVEKVHKTFEADYDKPIFIGETGWPSEGRQREDAVPSRVNEALFMRGVVDLAQKNGWQYNLIEAFDQPWKRISEGTVGGYWGLYDSHRGEKNILSGDVSNLPHWKEWLAVTIALLGGVVLLAGKPLQGNATRVALIATFAAGCLGSWLYQVFLDSRHWGEWLWFGTLFGLNLVFTARLMLFLNPAVSGWRFALQTWLAHHSQTLLVLLGIIAVWLTMAQIFDPRYRSFPTTALLIPALAYLLFPVRGPRLELGIFATLVALSLPIMLWQETLLNVQALGWAVATLGMYAALCRCRAVSLQRG